MSTIGKVLVLLHGALSLTVLAWAIGVMTNRIDWNTPPPKTGADGSPGVYDQQKAKAAEYQVGIERSYTRWSANLNQVAVLDAERYPRRTFYQVHLDMMRTGKGPTGQPVQNPVQDVLNPLATDGFIEVPRDKNRNLDFVRAVARKPYEVRPGIAADSMAGYDTKMTRIVEDIQASQVKSAQSIVEREKLNKEIVGVTQPMLVKGLRTLINEQKNIMDQAEAEDRYAAVFVTNREAEFGLFKKRRDAMLARVAELNTYFDAQKGGPKKGANDDK